MLVTITKLIFAVYKKTESIFVSKLQKQSWFLASKVQKPIQFLTSGNLVFREKSTYQRYNFETNNIPEFSVRVIMWSYFFAFLATCKELVVFTKFFDKLAKILPVQNIAPQLISTRIITIGDEEEIASIARSLDKAVFVLRKVAHSLEAGVTRSFLTLLTIMEEHHGDAAVVATDIRKEMEKYSGMHIQ